MLHLTPGSSIVPLGSGPGYGAAIANLPRDVHRLVCLMVNREMEAHRKRRRPENSALDTDRVGLISDFLAICAVDPLANRPGGGNLDRFCRSLLGTERPSWELMGTYLAALQLVPKDEPDVRPRIRRTMLAVLQRCVEMLSGDLDPVARI